MSKVSTKKSTKPQVETTKTTSKIIEKPIEPKQKVVTTKSETNLKNTPVEQSQVETEDGWLTTLKYQDLDICQRLKEACASMGFDCLTEIQAKAIPSLLAGKDVLAQAKTGSGKTLAFLIPSIELLVKAQFKSRNGTGIIILTPTRELALQIYSVASELMEHMQQTHTILIGGSNKHLEEQKLIKGVNLIVSTPGRLLDHLINTKDFDYSNLLAFVMDEADRILEVGFEQELRAIIDLLPKTRQTMLFSATQTTKIADIARLSLNGTPVCVGVSDKKESATVTTLEQGYCVVKPKEKFQLLFTFLKKNINKKIMVFFSSCASVKFHTEVLNYMNIPVLDLHGKMKQKKRTATFFSFCNAESGILLSTDVAARGLDIPAVDWILQYDPPENPKEYIHRVGRTARAGKQGKALLFLLENERGFLRYLKESNVPLNELTFPQSKLSAIQEKYEKTISTNYYLNKSAIDAFNGFIRAYVAHSLKDAYDLDKLDTAGVSRSFGLTRTPFVNVQALDIGVETAMRKKRKQDSAWISSSKKKVKGTK